MLNQTQVETLKLLHKGGLTLTERQGIAMRFPTKRIGNDISLARMDKESIRQGSGLCIEAIEAS